MSDQQRQYLPGFAEIIDRLTVDQIKEVLVPHGREDYADEMRRLEHDLEIIATERRIGLSAHLLRSVITLAQINLHIWHLKDRMQVEPERYGDYLKRAHQLNGIRNQLKNRLLELSGERQPAAFHTNTETDGYGDVTL